MKMKKIQVIQFAKMFARRLKRFGFLNARNDEGNTVLHYAAERNNLKLLKEMVEAGAFIDATNELLQTPLITAVEYENREAAIYLLDNGASIHFHDHEGYTPLHMATIDNDMKMVKLLLERGANLNSVTDDGETPLHHACQYGSHKLVRFYLKWGANINQESECGTPIFQAISQGYLLIVDILLEKGADLDLMDPNGGGVEDALQALKDRILHLDDDGSDWESDDEDDDRLRDPGLYEAMRLKMANVEEIRTKAKEGDVLYFIDSFNKGIVPLKRQVYPLLSEEAKDQLMQWAKIVQGDMQGLYSLFHGGHDLVDPSGPISSLLCNYLVLPKLSRLWVKIICSRCG